MENPGILRRVHLNLRFEFTSRLELAITDRCNNFEAPLFAWPFGR
jgi:hypothetical protein